MATPAALAEPSGALRGALVTTLLDAVLEALCHALGRPRWTLDGAAESQLPEIVRYRTILQRFRRALPAEGLRPEHLGEAHEALRGWTLTPKGRACVLEPDRALRGAGAHYTPAALARAVVLAALEPLREASPRALRVLDPAVGGGVFLLEAGRWLLAREPSLDLDALRECLHGVDRDPLAVSVAQRALALAFGDRDTAPGAFEGSVLRGDSLVDAGAPEAVLRALGAPALDWERAFPGVFAREAPGFDAVLGNPPWVAYAGRATQPLGEALRRWYTRQSPAFRGYRTLHGLFVRRSAELLRPGGRLGLVLPTSLADLDGYRFTRGAHDALCAVDDPLPDLGDGRFAGVFQPSMALLSTRRREALEAPTGRVWALSRGDLDEASRALLARLDARPKVPSGLFGERGFQSLSEDRGRLLPWGSREGLSPLREGGDVREFQRLGPRWGIVTEGLGARWRADAGWAEVRALVRQTARFPIAAASDGGAFRNSLLAVFSAEAFPWTLVLAYLNSAPARWFHYHRWRDARQGMPQVKVQHLRALPELSGPARETLLALGERLGARNAGLSPEERRALDAAAGDALDLGAPERALVDRWVAGRVGISSETRVVTAP